MAEQRWDGALEMVICDYRDIERQAVVVLRDPVDTQRDARLDALQLPSRRQHRSSDEWDRGGGERVTGSSQARFDRQPRGVSPESGGEEDAQAAK